MGLVAKKMQEKKILIFNFLGNQICYMVSENEEHEHSCSEFEMREMEIWENK